MQQLRFPGPRSDPFGSKLCGPLICARFVDCSDQHFFGRFKVSCPWDRCEVLRGGMETPLKSSMCSWFWGYLSMMSDL